MRAILPAIALWFVSPIFAASPDRVTAILVDPSAPEVTAIRQAGEAATTAVATKLIATLTTALANGGPVKAVDVCHLRALGLTTEKLPAHPLVVSVKRTSLRLRNPANAPDDAERLALDHVAKLVDRGEPPPAVLVQRVDKTPTAAPEWRVYRSIMVQPACLACHGDPNTQSPALRTLLHERYPKDTATGYAAGDWRGLIRVTVRQP